MDAVGVALASVITSGVLGITTGGIAVWTTRQSAKLAREARTHQRLAESYLEVLRFVEREARRWAEGIADAKNTIAGVKAAYEEMRDLPADFLENSCLTQFRFAKAPEPAVTATIKAHLRAFGSPKVHNLYDEWLSLTTEIDTELHTLNCKLPVNIAQISLHPDGLKRLDLTRLDELATQERARHQGLADAIAKELGHR